MPGKGQYSDKSSVLRRSISFAAEACPTGAVAAGAPSWQHGTLTTDGVAGAQPRTYDRFTNKGPGHEQSTLSKVFTEAGMQPREFTRKNPRNVPDLKLDIRCALGSSARQIMRGAGVECPP
jgi:hypothetical protein